MRILVVATAFVSLAACSRSVELAVCKGPAFALNTGHWQASPADLKMAMPGSTP